MFIKNRLLAVIKNQKKIIINNQSFLMFLL